MRKHFPKRIIRNTALCGLMASTVALPFMAVAQADDGGFLMTLKLGERLISRDSDGPDTSTTNGVTNQAISDVALQITSETRTETVNFDLSGGYRFVDGPETDGVEAEFTDPSIRLSYAQDAAASAVSVAFFANRIDLDNASTLDVAQAADGTLDSDFADLTQDGGNRNRLRFDGQLSLRDDAPFGLTFGVQVDDFSYDNLPDTSTLTDYTYGKATAGARFDITQVMQANAAVYVSQTSDDFGTDERYGIEAGLILTQPNGQITIDAEAISGDDGSQLHLSAARSFTLENTTARFGLGVSQASTDDVFVTGTASLKHTFADDSPWGTFTANADRDLTRDGRGDEDLVTTLSVASQYALTPVANLRLSAGFARSEDVATGDTVDLSQANLSVTYALNPDWTATAGVGMQSRDPSDESATDSTTLSLGISRAFDLRR
jgi:hypothetical protein